MYFSWEYFIESGHTEYKQNVPTTLARCEDYGRKIYTKKCLRNNFTYAFFKSKYIKRVAMVSSQGIS